jgi:hypothetical protein
MEGLPTVSRFLRFVADALPFIGDRRVIARAHPVLPLHDVARAAGVALAPQGLIAPAGGGSLESDIAAADAVIYLASSTAFTAGYMGLPLIHWRGGGWLRDDPLRDCDALKCEVVRPEDMGQAIARIEAMDAAQFAREHEQFRTYIDQYLSRPTSENLAPFFAH